MNETKNSGKIMNESDYNKKDSEETEINIVDEEINILDDYIFMKKLAEYL